MSRGARPGRSDDSRQVLMDAAIDCFARHGYQATSIDRIATAAGVTKGALYYHFQDKEDLLFAAVTNRVGQFERRVVTDLRPVAGAAEALRLLARTCIEHATKSNHRRLIVTLMIEALDTHPRLEAEFRQMMERFRGFLREIVRRGQATGELRATVDPGLAAQVFAGAIMGAEIQYYQDPTRFDLVSTVNAFVEEHIRWLEAPPGREAERSRPAGRKRRTATWSVSNQRKSSSSS